MSWDILKKTQNFEIFYPLNKFRIVFYVTIYHPDKSNSFLRSRNNSVLNTINDHKPRQKSEKHSILRQSYRISWGSRWTYIWNFNKIIFHPISTKFHLCSWRLSEHQLIDFEVGGGGEGGGIFSKGIILQTCVNFWSFWPINIKTETHTSHFKIWGIKKEVFKNA